MITRKAKKLNVLDPQTSKIDRNRCLALQKQLNQTNEFDEYIDIEKKAVNLLRQS